MASGDIGYFDAGGRLFVVGRDDEMIISGGENIYPIEVEKALMTHPAVTEAVVLGVEDEKYGQRLVGFVIPRSATTATPDALKQHRAGDTCELQSAARNHHAQRTAQKCDWKGPRAALRRISTDPKRFT